MQNVVYWNWMDCDVRCPQLRAAVGPERFLVPRGARGCRNAPSWLVTVSEVSGTAGGAGTLTLLAPAFLQASSNV